MARGIHAGVPSLHITIGKLSPVLRDFLRAGVRVNLPPPGFDPRGATDHQLALFHLPPRPDPATSPRAYGIWRDVMSGPPQWPVLPSSAPVHILFAEATTGSRPHRPGPTNVTFEEASTNWSGAFVRPRDFSRLTRVQGIWTVPTVKPPTPDPGTYASSAWIGLDGYDPASRSLPQIGTGHWVTEDMSGHVTLSYFAWWQWFARGRPNHGQTVLSTVPVSPGDQIYAQITPIDERTASLFIINLTTNQAFPWWFDFVNPIQPTLSPTNPLPIHIEGRTAEWVMERPQQLASPILYPLPDYTTTSFDLCLAGTDSTTFPELDLTAARLIRMVDWEIPPKPTQLVSTPARAGANSMLLRYGP